MTCHTIDFNFADDAPCKRTSPTMMMMMPMAQPSPAVESFGWGDFPVMTCEDLYVSIQKPSDCTASTQSLEFEDDTLGDSEVEEDDDSSATLALAATTTNAAVTPHRQVSFDQVHVREHEVVLGAHPLAVGGYPLELGWAYNDVLSCSVDVYEQEYSSMGNKLRRYSHLERHFKLAEFAGGDLVRVKIEEDHRKVAEDVERSRQPIVATSTDEDDNEHLSEYTKRQMLRSASYTHLSRFL